MSNNNIIIHRNSSSLRANIVVVGDHDVLSGRGVNIADHPGNQRFRLLIASRANQLVVAPKKDVAEGIVQYIQEGLGGRFLKRNQQGKAARGSSLKAKKGPWEELTKKEVLKKTCQALHDCIRLEGYANGVVSEQNQQVATTNNNNTDPKSSKTNKTREHDSDAVVGKPSSLNRVESSSTKQQQQTTKRENTTTMDDDTIEVSIMNKKDKIIIHKSSRYKNHDPNVQYFYCCRRISTYLSNSCDRSAIAEQVIAAMAQKGLSFWIDDDEIGLRKMTESERWKAVKKKIANDKFHCVSKNKKIKNAKQRKIGKMQVFHNHKHQRLVYEEYCNRLTREREEMALQAMISLGQSPV
mmetsp:Transcript_12207/g.17896  ORF Transcript_12207/g.17896 Transcript_12207/m.17896 type:complete len:353 (-) Transcript_12207:332-1390(-)